MGTQEIQGTTMVLTGLDIWVIIIYLVSMLALGLAFGGRAGKSLEDYFISGRALPWWIAGTSMVATTFAADTPLAVTGLVIQQGIAGNWMWWSAAGGGMLTVFLYARLWRRSRVITDVELVELRYSGPEAPFLRGFRALYLAIIINSLIVGWVSYAMMKILQETVKPEQIPALAPMFKSITHILNSTLGTNWGVTYVANALVLLLLLGITGVFSVVSGLWGVSVTDFVMFWIAMFGCIALAFFALHWVGGMDGLRAGLTKTYGSHREVMRFIPDFFAKNPLMPLAAFFVFIGVTWWASWYPGAEPGGGGYVVQRMASCKNEKHSLLATLWFTMAHYGVRPWPWIIVALVAAVKFPGLVTAKDPGVGFPKVMTAILPAGWRGLMLVAFFAAFMSTIATQINWGASYVVSDFYKRFLNPSAGARHYTRVSRIASVVVLILGTIVSFNYESVQGAWRLMFTISAGTGLVFLLRWYWWRINAWSEISSMVASLAISMYLIYGFKWPMVSVLDYAKLVGIGLVMFFGMGAVGLWVGAHFTTLSRDINKMVIVTIFVMILVMVFYLIYPVKLEAHHHILITAISTILVWLPVTFLTRPVDEKRLEEFYRLVRPGGAGWAPMRAKAPDVECDKGIMSNILCWILGTIAVYCFLFGVGSLILGITGQGIILLVICLASGAGMYILMSKMGWEKVLR